MTISLLTELLQTQFPYNWTLPPDLKQGLLTTNQAFLLAKEKKQNPNIIAQELCQTIQRFLNDNQAPFVVQVAGPYINIDFSEEGLQEYFYKNNVEKVIPTKDSRILIDYFAPNVGKEMHVGHIRTADIGESLRRILSTQYKTVISNNHLGDWGIQFGFLIWGINHLKNLGLSYQTLEWEKETNGEIVKKLQEIYVTVNNLSENDETIRKECQANTSHLEEILQSDEMRSPQLDLWKKIIEVSLINYTYGEGYLGLNTHQTDLDTIHINSISKNFLKKHLGAWVVNEHHEYGQFDLIIGESFYIPFLKEAYTWVEAGIAIKEGNAIYFDLKDYGLGRCYVISSEGYSIYAGRDIVARFIWTALFGTNINISCADSRQLHSFKQTFKVIELIIQSKLYTKRPFFGLTHEQTELAIKILSQPRSLEHVSFGFMSLPEGTMSTRKGNVLLFETVKKLLEKEVERVLIEKTPNIKINPDFHQKVQKIAVAALKWQDLSKDREQDIIFDVNQVTKFEGNTGVYELYTLARVSNILKKNETSRKLEPENVILLNQVELDILKKMYQLPHILQSVSEHLKPHILCNYLFEFSTLVNSWYAEFSVAREDDLSRKDALLHLCHRIKIHIGYCLTLLGIEPIDSL